MQPAIIEAVKNVLPGIPHQFCQYHLFHQKRTRVISWKRSIIYVGAGNGDEEERSSGVACFIPTATIVSPGQTTTWNDSSGNSGRSGKE